MSSSSWKEILFFESTDYVIGFSEKRIGRKYSRAKANEISFACRQARNYFEQAYVSEYTIRPLLIYYGVLSLSRALILIIDASKREDSLSQSHGLSWNNSVNRDTSNIDNILLSKIVVNHGTFIDLINQTNNINFLLGNTTKPISHISLKKPNIKDSFALRDILERIANIKYSWNHCFGVSKNLAFATNFDVKDNLLHIIIHNKNDIFNEDDMNLMFNNQIVSKPLFEKGKITLVVNNTVEFGISQPSLKQEGGFAGFGDWHIIRNFDTGFVLSEVGMAFVASYSMGMLCRYFPSKWGEIFANSSGDMLRPVLLDLISHLERNFPKMISDFLAADYDILSKLKFEKGSTKNDEADS